MRNVILRSAAVSVGVAVCAGGAARGNVLVNPGFETGALAPRTGAPNPSAGVTAVQSAVVRSGTMAAQFTSAAGASGSTMVFQSFAVQPQVTGLSFWFRFDAVAAATMRLDLALDGNPLFFPVFPGAADTWVQYVGSGPILAAPNITSLRIYVLTTGGGPMPVGAHVWMDDVEVVGVPAPGAIATLAVGPTLVARRRRR